MSQAGQFYQNTLVSTLTGDIGGAVSPVAGNIDIIGGTGINVEGFPLANTIEISAPFVAGSFVTDAGTAVPLVGVINILGGTNINTAGAGNSVTFNLDDAITLTTVNATTFDTNVVLAGLTLSGTSIIADGTDTDININITAKGGGQVIINELKLTTDLAVTEGGTGVSTLLDHGVLVGNATDPLTVLAVGLDGQVLIGSSAADPVFGTLASADGSVEYTAGAGTLDLSAVGIDRDNMMYVGKYGDDANDGLSPGKPKLTIQAAVTAAAAGDTIIVYPGTYTETITHAASNITILAQGKPSNCIITQADANVINFAGYTGIQYKFFQISCTAATTAIWTIEGTTGLCSFKECQISMTSAANIAAVAQPGIGRVTGAGTLTVVLGKAYYYHTGNGGGTANKGAFATADGGHVLLSLIEDLTVSNSGTALVSGIGIDTASTGNINIHDCIIDVTDPNSTIVVGLAYLSGTGTDSEFYRNTIHVQATNNTGYGFFSADTASTSRFFFNHVHVEDVAGSSYSYLVGATATVTVIFDDVIADDGASVAVGGIFYEVKSPVDGDMICSGPTAAGNRNITVANTDNTATASNACMCVSVGGATSTGDPYTNYLVTGAGTYSVGIDNSDSDNFKITSGATPSAGIDLFTMTSAGVITLNNDLDVSEGGTGVSAFTDHGLLIGNGAGDITVSAVGATGEVLNGNTTADPSWSTTCLATTFDTNVAAAGVTLAGTTLEADGTDTDIDLVLTPKGTGNVQITTLGAGIIGSDASGKLSSVATNQYALQVGDATSTLDSLGTGTAGQVLQSGGAAAIPAWSTATYPLTAAVGTILIASGANTITTLAPDTAGYVLTDGGAGVAPSWATPATVGTVTSVSGGTNISDSGTAADPVMDLDAAITAMTSITMSDTGSIQTTTTDTDTMLIQGYDVDGTAYVPFITITNANDPTCDLNTGVTIGTKYIYRTDGTDVPVADGGTGASTFTDGGLLVGATTGPIEALAVGGAGTILTGVAGANPAWTTATYPATVTQGDLLVASAANVIGVVAGGTATHVLTANGAGAAPTYQAAAAAAYCSDAEAIAGTVSDESVSPSTLKAKLGAQTSHGLPYGAATTGAIAWTAEPTDGQILFGDTGGVPALGTLTAGTGITVTNAAHSVTVASTGTTLNNQVGTSYTTVIGDAGKAITMTNASASTLTIPLNSSVAYAIGTFLVVVQLGAGQVTLTPTGGVTFRSADDAYKLVKQYSGCTLLKLDTDVWGIYGDVEA